MCRLILIIANILLDITCIYFSVEYIMYNIKEFKNIIKSVIVSIFLFTLIVFTIYDFSKLVEYWR